MMKGMRAVGKMEEEGKRCGGREFQSGRSFASRTRIQITGYHFFQYPCLSNVSSHTDAKISSLGQNIYQKITFLIINY